MAQVVKNLPKIGRPGFDPCVGAISWWTAWQPTPVFHSGESPWTNVTGGVHSMGSQRVDMTDRLGTAYGQGQIQDVQSLVKSGLSQSISSGAN